MKIVFSKEVLLEKLIPMMGTVSNKNTIPSIEGVLMETLGGESGNEVRLSTYDMNKGMRATVESLEIMEEGSYIINAQRLLQILRLLDQDEVTITVDERNNVTIESGESSFSLYAMRGNDFPNLPELSGEHGFSVSSPVLRRMIGKVIHSIADQDSRPMLCGAYFTVQSGRLEVVSCDSFTLSMCSIACEIADIGQESLQTLSFNIPGHALNELLRVLPDKEEQVQFYVARKHAILMFHDMIFFTRMIDGEYLDYQRIIPKNQTIFAHVDRARLLSALERANLVADEKIKGSGKSYVKLTFEGDQLTVASTSVNGKVSDTLTCRHEGEDLVIGFNCRYLINSVKAADSETLLLSLKSPTQSLTIEAETPSEEESFFYMILPVRMTD